MKKVSLLCLIVSMMLVLSFSGCKKAEQSTEAPKTAGQAQVPTATGGFVVSGGTLEKGGIGYVLSSEQDKAAVAMKQLETPFSNTVTIKCQTKAALPSGTRNGFITYGESPSRFGQAGIRIGGMKYVIEGHYAEKVEVPRKFDQNKLFDIEITLDIKGKNIVMKVDGTEVKTKMKYRPSTISYVGYTAANTKTEFSDLQISGN